MKKLFVAVAAVAALSFASCGNKTNAVADAADSLAAEQVDTTALAPETKSTFDALVAQLTKALDGNDAKGLTTALANLAATYKTIANSGKLEELKSYGQLVKNFVTEHADKIKSVAGNNSAISNLVSNIQSLPTDAGATLDAAKAAVSNETVGLASAALQKGAAAGATAEAAAAALKAAPAAATEAVSNAANKAVDNAKEKAAETVDAAKAKVQEKANAAAEKTNEAVNNAKEKAANAAANAASKAVKGLGL